MNLMKEWMEKKAMLKKAQSELLEVEKMLYNENIERLKYANLGVTNIEKDGYILKVTKKESISVDSKKVIELGLEKNSAFNTKFTLNKRVYDSISEQDRKIIYDCITTKPAKPGFEVKEVENGQV